jgi:hypothetical protein
MSEIQQSSEGARSTPVGTAGPIIGYATNEKTPPTSEIKLVQLYRISPFAFYVLLATVVLGSLGYCYSIGYHQGQRKGICMTMHAVKVGLGLDNADIPVRPCTADQWSTEDQ